MNASAHSSFLRLARLGWYPAAALALAILLAAVPVSLTPPGGIPALSEFEGLLVFERTALTATLEQLTLLATLLAAAYSLALATLLFVKKRHDRMGLFLAYYMVGHGLVVSGLIELLQPFWPAAWWVNTNLLGPIYLGPVTMTLFGMFPDGRWAPRWAPWLIPASAVVVFASAGSGAALAWFGMQPSTLQSAAYACWAGIAAGGVYAQVYRYRWISPPEQRQQTKWVLYGLALAVLVNIAVSPGWFGALRLPPGALAPWWLYAAVLAYTVTAFFLPAALTVAVMRYRLYDIDLIIRRSLVYGALTASLAAAYFGSVALVQQVFPAGSQVSVALSTLAVAALFAPLRRRIQDAIDRRFFHRKYNATQVLARFAGELREQVDVDRLAQSLTRAVDEALQPDGVSLWLRKPDGQRPATPGG